MNKVCLLMYVWDNENADLSQNWVMLQTQINLPFVPFAGLEIQLPRQPAWKIKNVCWDVEAEFFRCYFYDLFPDLYSIDGSDQQDWIDNLTSMGWNIGAKST